MINIVFFIKLKGSSKGNDGLQHILDLLVCCINVNRGTLHMEKYAKFVLLDMAGYLMSIS